MVAALNNKSQSSVNKIKIYKMYYTVDTDTVHSTVKIKKIKIDLRSH